MSPVVATTASRRRFLQIFAATSVCGLVGLRANAATASVQAWQGEALGADASIVLAGIEPRHGDDLLRACRGEISRLEGVFSLHEPTSHLSRLNAEGFLADPPVDLIQLLDGCRRIFELSGRAFDPTIQPLWRLYAETYGDPLKPRVPTAAEVDARRRLVAFDAVSWDGRRVLLAKPGMAMTLNGIAQGAITDSITSLLRAGGARHALVNVGEYHGLGRHPEGRPWQVGIQDPRFADSVADFIELTDQAVATSGAYGGRFGDSGLSHLIDPRTAKSPDHHLSVSVRHPSATIADGLSTAFSFMTESEIASAAAQIGGVSVVLVRANGSLARL